VLHFAGYFFFRLWATRVWLVAASIVFVVFFVVDFVEDFVLCSIKMFGIYIN
jgi:hypothetical protein